MMKLSHFICSLFTDRRNSIGIGIDCNMESEFSPDLFEDRYTPIIASMFEDNAINPANGLPMVCGTGGVDVAGNPYGTDDSFNSCSIDDSFSSCGIDDSFSSGVGCGTDDW
jgi:hypothetical protein